MKAGAAERRKGMILEAILESVLQMAGKNLHLWRKRGY